MGDEAVNGAIALFALVLVAAIVLDGLSNNRKGDGTHE